MHVDFVIACSRTAHDAKRRRQSRKHFAREDAIRRDNGIGAARVLRNELGRTAVAHDEVVTLLLAKGALYADIGEIEPDDGYRGHIVPPCCRCAGRIRRRPRKRRESHTSRRVLRHAAARRRGRTSSHRSKDRAWIRQPE